ncbi:MAG: MBL fold metallo-hydrolase [Cetobacterium sp.]
MEIQVLVENKSLKKELLKEHGLSLYIKTKNRNVLFDVGESNKFLKNAEKLGVNLQDVDYLVLSHGHKDHGGGLLYFLNKNKKAKIFCSKHYFEKHYKKILGVYIDIGIPYEHLDIKRFNFVEDTLEVENLILFHCLKSNNLNPLNSSLYVKSKIGKYEKDTFKHELNMIVKEKNQNFLFVGCAHNGVEKILEESKNIVENIDSLIGGLHLSSRTSLNKNEEYINKTIKILNKLKIKKLYTCHCTGEYAVKKLDKEGRFIVEEIQTGSKIKLD